MSKDSGHRAPGLKERMATAENLEELNKLKSIADRQTEVSPSTKRARANAYSRRRKQLS